MNSPFRYFALVAAGSFLILQHAQAQVGTNNPTGVAGDYNGQITTAGSYDPFTGNASREIEDIVVAGSVGAYPLKWVRRLNTRAVIQGNPLGGNGGWSHSYQWKLKVYNATPTPTPHPSASPALHPDAILTYPDGRTAELPEPWEPVCCDAAAESPFGRHDRIVKDHDAGEGNWKLLLADGGVVKFHAPTASNLNYKATSIIDPYEQAITLEYDGNLLKKIKEPGPNPRYLEIWYETKSNPDLTVIQRVEANDGRGTVTQSVAYSYERKTTYFSYYPYEISGWYLARADYSDGTHAEYKYTDTNMPGQYQGDPHAVHYKLVSECKDVRFAGPMKTIRYDYVARGAPDSETGWGQIRGERNASNHLLSWVPLYYDPPPWYNEDTLRRENRPDNSYREFRYHGDFYVKSITDFYGNPSQASIYVDPQGGGVSEVRFTDARQKTTVKTREPNFAATVRVTHPPPDSSYTETVYWDSARPHYVRFQFDERRNRTEYLRYPNHAVQQINYPDGGYETFVYNSLGQVTEHRMTSGGTEYFSYDQRGLKQTHTPPATESDDPPHSTQYIYYGTQSGPGGGLDEGPGGPAGEPNRPWRPDLIDRLKCTVDPRGHTTWFYYNPRGQVTHINYHDGTGVENHYNDDGTLQWTEDELHHRTSYFYDIYGRVTDITNHLNETVTNSYAPWNGHGPLSHTTASIYSVESHMGKKTDHDYDLNFRRLWTKQAPGDQYDEAITNFHYDAVGNLDRMEDPRHKFTSYGYDERNRQTSIWNEDLNETTFIKYDAAGNKEKETRPDLVFRSWDYDEMNRLGHAYDWRTNPDPQPHQTTTYTRDYAGNARFITDTKGAVYEFEFDDLNRKTKAKYPATAPSPTPTETWLYDFAGNLKEYKNPAGQIRHFHHDHRNRQDHSWWTGSGLLGPEITTVYDYASRVSRITTNNGETIVAFGYDHANRKIWEDQTVAGHPPRRIQTDLNGDGMRRNLQIVDPDAPGSEIYYYWPQMQGTSYLVNYDYTARNQLKSIQGEDWSFDYSYDPSGNMTARTAHYNGTNGSVTSSTSCPTGNYDALNRPRMWQQSSVDGLFAVSEYRYDQANREEATWRWEDGNRGERFTYEPTNQLKTAVYNAQNVWTGTPTDARRSVAYDYALNKLNRTSMTETLQSGTPVVTNYSPNNLNQYGSVGGVNYSYDTNFNLTGAGTLSATYDAANRLMSAAYSYYGSTNNVQFVYDGFGRCVKRTVDGYVAVFAYDAWKPIAEWDEWNGCQAWNVYGPGADEILLRHQPKYGYIRFHPDRHGNVAFLVDNDGAVVEKYTYDAFGRPKITDLDGQHERLYSYYGHRFLFQGRDYIHELGIYDYRHRFYYPKTGRFLQIDPTGFDAGDMNLFRYCGDDPWNRSDPLGLEEEIFGPGQQELAVDLARRHVEAANLDPGRKSISARITTKGGGMRSTHYYPSKMVPVYHHGKGYQLGATVDGRPYTESGTTYELERPKETGRRVAVLVHGHNNVRGGKKGERNGIADAGWSSYDEKVRNIDRTDEANPGVWYSRRNGKEVPSDRASREKASRGGGGSSSNAVSASSTDGVSSRPSARDIDLAHQATGVPSLGAESVNFAPGRP